MVYLRSYPGYEGDSISFPFDDSLLNELTEPEREQILEIIEDAGIQIERDDAILIILSGLKAMGWERRASP